MLLIKSIRSLLVVSGLGVLPKAVFSDDSETPLLRLRRASPQLGANFYSSFAPQDVAQEQRGLQASNPCLDPNDNFCHPNAVCIPISAHPGFECLCNNEDGWEGDGIAVCYDYDECEHNYPCVPSEDGGYCEDRNPDMMPPKYDCGCRRGFKSVAHDEYNRATQCVRESCATGTHNCDSNAVCTDDVVAGGNHCTCNAGFHGDGSQCTMTTAMAQQRSTDLGLRFSKIFFPSGTTPSQAQLPMNAASYPIDEKTFAWLKTSRAHSVRVPGVCNECDIDLQVLINAIGGEPTHPSSSSSSPYWDELSYVVDMQVARHNNTTPSDIMPLPTLWQNLDIAGVAEAVHREYPGIHHVALLQSMDSGGPNAIGFKINNTVIPATCHTEFVREIVMMSDVLTWAIARVGTLDFEVKWTFGRIRPEEIANMIRKDEITTGPPASLVAKIKALPWEASATSFTAYPKGSPPHPSFPAMHAAGSAASLWMAVILDLTDAEWCQVKLTDYAVSFARTVAGVHYVSDNVAGLQLGQEIIARRLPKFLHDTYGSDMAAVQARIEEVRFDWKDFLETDCAKGLV